jgi:hypothetical protein
MALPTLYTTRVQVAAGARPVQLIAPATDRDWTEVELLAGGPVYVGGPEVEVGTGFRLTARDPRPFPTGLGFFAVVDQVDDDAVVQVIGG